ncbi:HAMP domain-containing sensor histidine kinase [Erythrobacter sp. NFXS35]|uniref:sensor histidine kinase n=1 Tax=Erythrobacter sp. NFXS35 TaxID=2818436 RepID=UPI0032DF77C2
MIEARRSIFSRLVAGAILLSLVLLAGLWWLTYQTVSTSLQEAAQAEVDVDLAGLADIYATGGQAELEARIADRIALTPVEGSASHYLLADDRGMVIAGDLARWPALDPRVSESGVIAIGKNSQGFARAVQLGPDLRLVVARSIAIRAPLLSSLTMAFAVGGAVFVALVALLGRFAALGLQRRIERINLAFREPQDGSGLVAARRSSAGDEIDELAAHSAAALARMNDLLAAYKDTSEQLAHEIRTPLSHLDNRLVKALAEQPAAEIARRLVEARAEIRRIVQTLESLLDIAASKAHRGDRSGLAPVDLSALVTGICDLYSGSAEESGLELRWNVAPDVAIAGDERQLRRLVTNMLDNALKYVPSGGRIAVTLDPGPVLMVADDGPGIDPRDRERIFERFYRGRNKSEEVSGSGLGLALAHAIAERHGLALTLEEPAAGGLGGAVFRIAAAA